MKKQEKAVNEATLLRLIAEEELKQGTPLATDLTGFDNLKLLHELQVHQIELEMQNEELKVAHAKAYEAIEKYVELYDFAPTAYLTLSKKAEILELNHSAACMLGKDRTYLKNTGFGFHISYESLSTFNQLLDRCFKLNEKQSCELQLIHKTDKVDKSLYVHVDAQLSKDLSKCLFTMTDISEHRKLKMELNKTVELLREHKLHNS